MIPDRQIRVVTQSPSVDTHELVSFLNAYAEKVTVDEVHPGPQASVDWFLDPNIHLLMGSMAAHPFVGGFLGTVSGTLTSKVAIEVYKKIAEKVGEAFLSKGVETFLDYFLKVFHRSKKHNAAFVRGGRTIPVPPLGLTLALPAMGTLSPVNAKFVFTTELSDEDIHSAYRSVGKVIERVMKTQEDRATYDRRMAELMAGGQTEKAMEMMGLEEYAKLRRGTYTYVYRPRERAWVDAYVLAVQEQLEHRVKIFGEMLIESDEARSETIKEMIADIERQIEDGRVR